ncbi:MAG TPA: phosphoheptose isomerase, partial [Spirochaetia bacterium]|nr:phosphoheptose isomerase [Spirochaetia bacterium]
MIAQYPQEILGAAHIACYEMNPGVLIKLLDSAMRLPLQV